nr:hypothetical protein [Micromonospora orduensis]
MTSLVLLGWAAMVAVLARPVLTAPWMASLPRLAVGLWLGAELSVTVAVLTAGLLVAAMTRMSAANPRVVAVGDSRSAARLPARLAMIAASVNGVIRAQS